MLTQYVMSTSTPPLESSRWRQLLSWVLRTIQAVQFDATQNACSKVSSDAGSEGSTSYAEALQNALSDYWDNRRW